MFFRSFRFLSLSSFSLCAYLRASAAALLYTNFLAVCLPRSSEVREHDSRFYRFTLLTFLISEMDVTWVVFPTHALMHFTFPIFSLPAVSLALFGTMVLQACSNFRHRDGSTGSRNEGY
jgi:hypothetical protein